MFSDCKIKCVIFYGAKNGKNYNFEHDQINTSYVE